MLAVDTGGARLLAEAAALASAACLPCASVPALQSAQSLAPRQEYEAGLRRLQQTVPDGALDRSRADFSIARRQLSRGVDAATVAAIIIAGDRAQGLSSAVAQAYAARTVAAAQRGRWG